MDAVSEVWNPQQSGGISSDEIPLHDVARAIREENPILQIPAYDVSLSHCRATNLVRTGLRRADTDQVRQRSRSGRVCSNQIPLNQDFLGGSEVNAPR